MTYKTILVHLNHEARARQALTFAAELARRFGAHLVGLHVIPSIGNLGRLALGATTATRLRTALDRLDQDLRRIHEEIVARQTFTAEWRSIEAAGLDPAATVLEHARAADLVIASQADPNWELSGRLDFPDRLALGAGRPVIVVPNQDRAPAAPRIVTIAWDHRREAARAVADALPLLSRADKVHLLTISETAGGETTRYPEAEIERSLVRHGIHLDASRALATQFTVGEEIRVRAIDLGSDMIVMGCYGHSRMREFALGGVTRHMMRDTTIPILFSH